MHPDTPLSLVVVPIVLLAIAWLAVGLRCYGRVHMLGSFTMDDWAMLVALALFTPFSIIPIVGALNYGWGRSLENLSPHEIEHSFKLFKLGELTLTPAILACKTSISIFLLRLAVSQRRRYRIVIYMTLAVYTITSVYFIIGALLQCRPLSYFWRQFSGIGPKGRCVMHEKYIFGIFVNAAFGAATDWVYAAIPVWMLWGVNMPRRTKLQVGFVLSLGVAASGATLVRFNVIKQASDGRDFTRDMTDPIIWATLEPGLGIVAASVATLRPLVRAISRRWGHDCEADGLEEVGRTEKGKAVAVHVRAVGDVHGSPPHRRSYFSIRLRNVRDSLMFSTVGGGEGGSEKSVNQGFESQFELLAIDEVDRYSREGGIAAPLRVYGGSVRPVETTGGAR